MFNIASTEDEYIVEIHYKEPIDKWKKGLHHGSHELAWCVRESEMHDQPLK